MAKSERQPQGFKFYILGIKKYKKEPQNLIKRWCQLLNILNI